MNVDRPLEDYHRHRNDVLSLLDNARPLMSRTYAEAWPALQDYRERLTKAMQDLQVHKHEAIFDPIMASTRSDRATAKALKADCILLGTEYAQYRQKWDKRDVQARWTEYLLAAISMMTTIRKRLAAQDEIIRTLAPV